MKKMVFLLVLFAFMPLSVHAGRATCVYEFHDTKKYPEEIGYVRYEISVNSDGNSSPYARDITAEKYPASLWTTFNSEEDLKVSDFLKDGKLYCPDQFLLEVKHYERMAGWAKETFAYFKVSIYNGIMPENEFEIGGPVYVFTSKNYGILSANHAESEIIDSPIQDIEDPDEVCKSIFGGTFGDILRQTLKFMQYLAPILALIFSTIDFLKAQASQDADATKKATQTFLKRLIIVVAIFFAITLLRILLSFIDITCMI